jgi:serine/threonine-protein kinase
VNHELWQRVKHVLVGALERPRHERAAFLDDACAGDSALRAEVESLLAADAGSGVLDSHVATLADEQSDATTVTRLSAGARLGPYEIVAFLGAGGMGEVYRARDTRLGREVAIKALHAEAGGDAERRFDDEARAASALNHPNIVTVYDVGAEGGLRYVVAELLEGVTLRARLQQGPLSPNDCLRLGRQVAAGLAAAHDQGIVHRDLKPENLFLTRDGRIKILDFGLAKRLWGGDARQPGSSRTLPGTVLGTVGYMAPEQVRGEPVDARSDLFALGALLYEMLTGERAFSGRSAVETMTAILVDEPPAFASPVSPALERVLLQCVRKDPAQRLQTAQDVEAMLAAIQESAATDPSGRVARAAPAPARRALAVLPFVNITGDAELDYLCEGIAEELINALARTDGLRVAARSSSFRARSDSIARIGGLLGVDTVLEGSVRRMGQRLRVTARLVNVADGYPAWSERFDVDAEDIPTVQDTVAERVVEALRLSHGAGRRPGRSSDPVAYRLYLKGLYFWSKRHQGGLEAALGAFRQSTERDPRYAPAWAGLADSYALLGHAPYDVLPPREALPKAKAAIVRALELDPELAAAHATLGWIQLHYDWDWAASGASFERAVALDPERAATHHWHGFYLSALGRSGEALKATQRAWELDPLSLIVNSQLCQAHYYARRFEEVAAAAQQVLAMDPGFAVADYWLGCARAAQGRYQEAIPAFEALAEHGGGRTTALAMIGNAKARAGDRDAARAISRELEALGAERYVPAFHHALVHIGLGDTDQAFAALERAEGERADVLAFASVEPLFDPLRADPRFDALLRRLSLGG